MSVVIYRVTAHGRDDQWFASFAEASHAANEIVSSNSAAGIWPAPLPKTAADFLLFIREHRPRVTGGLTRAATEAIKEGARDIMRPRVKPSPEVSLALAIAELVTSRGQREQHAIAMLEHFCADTPEARDAIRACLLRS